MFNQDNLKQIKEITEEFFRKMTFEVEIDLLPQVEQVLSINLEAEEPQILIGERGETLFEIQHLLKIILKRKIQAEEIFYLDLDVNDYKKKKNDYLREMAKSLAEEVSKTRQEKSLPPMPSRERRIIHLELAGRSDVVSESVGQEPERKVVIRPILDV